MFSKPDSLVEFSQTNALNFLKKSNKKPLDLKVDLSYVSSSEEYRLTALMLYDNLRKIGISLYMKPGLWSTNWQRAKSIKTAPNIIWRPMGATYPASITVDRLGAPRVAGGVSSTARDLAIIGQLIINNGVHNERQMV